MPPKKMPSLLTGTAKRYAILTIIDLISSVTLLLGVMAAGFGMMFFGVAGMAMRGVGVVRGFLVVAGFVMPGGLAMMLRGLLVVVGGLVMMLDACVIAHGALPVGG
jgi:hypothetical protein